jgi:hypothetical protein
VVVVLGIAVVLLAGCAGAAGPNNVAEVATGHTSGFWAGLWHGVIMPIAFVVSLFSDSVNIYDVHNNGGWYNLGFVLGAGVLLGSGGRGASHRRRSK